MRPDLDDALQRLAEQERLVKRLQSDYSSIVRSRFFGIRSIWHGFKTVTGVNRGAIGVPESQPPRTASAVIPGGQTRIERLVTSWRERTAAQPLSDRPIVTIVIPVMNHLAVTVRCLQSIVDSWFATLDVQIVLVDDGSDDGAAALAERLPGLDFVRNGRNFGFVDACNRGAALSRAKYIYFLNNDTIVRNGWLDALVSTLESDESIGAAGSKLVYPDGRLQEAGGIVFRDGGGWNYGRGDDSGDSRYSYVRDVDYCSAASLLVRRELFERLGGFDRIFAPGYYEDADLCFAIRALGYRVVYQPRSVVVHDEGTTAGSETSSGGMKRFQARNRPRFVEKWFESLQTHTEPGAGFVPAAARRLRRGQSILVVDSYVPLHDKEAGSNRLYAILQMLLDLRYHVFFLPDNYAALEPYTSQLQAMGIEVLHHVTGGRSIESAVDEILPLLDAAWICRPELYAKYEPIVRRNLNTKLIYDTVDLHFLRLQRESALLGKGDEIWKSSQEIELASARAADLTIAVTQEERSVLSGLGVKHVGVIPTINNLARTPCGPYDETRGLLFIGSYNHTPNRDAVQWLCNEVMPIVWRSLPDLRVTLLGNEPDASVTALASKRVDVPGYVKDVESYFVQSRIFVAPLRYGAGHKGKIGHSLSYGLPVISTAIGVEGYGLVDERDCLIADDASAFAKAIVRLYTDRELWERLAAASVQAVKPFGSDAVRQTVNDLLRNVLGTN